MTRPPAMNRLPVLGMIAAVVSLRGGLGSATGATTQWRIFKRHTVLVTNNYKRRTQDRANRLLHNTATALDKVVNPVEKPVVNPVTYPNRGH